MNENIPLIWIDVETTGLDPKSSVLLEVALVLTTPQLDPLYSGDWVIWHEDLPAIFEATPERVQEMHTTNGLWDACVDSDATLESVEQAMFAAITVAGAQRGRIAGFNPTFDRRFIDAYLPKVGACLSYRHFDVSTLHYAEQQWPGGLAAEWNAAMAGVKHRALADIQAALALARMVRERRYCPVG
jgi:oligoribonuclease